MAEQNNNQQDLNQLLQVRYDKLHELQENGKDPFVITKYDVTNHSTDIIDNFETMEGKPVSIAGRMMFKRVMGKASFCNIQDLKGRIQVYVARDNIGEEIYKDFKKSDIGDIWGVKGYAFRTKTGEISIHAEEMTLLSKSLQILPEKFHGLTDTDMRYRQRYVDLIMNQDSKNVFIKRSQILKEIRNFLADRDFMEVETPMLVANAGGAAARPFITHHNTLDIDMYLRIATELYLKRLIVAGLEKVYDMDFISEIEQKAGHLEFTSLNRDQLLDMCKILHFRQQKKYSEMLDLWGKMVPNLPNEALKVRYDATLGRLQDMNETEKKQAIAYLKERMAGMTGSTLERYRQIVTELSDYQGIRFETGGLQEALAKARKENKAVFVDCYTSWCGPCKMMSSKVFPDKQAGDFFNPRFISLKIDMEKDEGKELAQKWNIRVFPTYLILDPQGEIVYTSQGYIPAEELIRRMNEGLEQWKNNIKTGK